MSERIEKPEEPVQNPELEDTREFTDEELVELRLYAEFLRKHPEIRPSENPSGYKD